MKKIFCMVMVGIFCLLTSGCSVLLNAALSSRLSDKSETKVDLSGMTEFSVREYSLYYPEAWTSLATDQLRLSGENSIILLTEIIKSREFRAPTRQKQLDFFYEKMTEYVQYVENTPIGEEDFWSLGFSEDDVFMAGKNYAAIMPFMMSDGTTVVYSIIFDRNRNLLARLNYYARNETAYPAERESIKKILETFQLNEETEGEAAEPNFDTINQLHPEDINLFFGDPEDGRTGQLTGKDGQEIQFLHYQYSNYSFTFCNGELIGVYVQPGGAIFPNFDTITASKAVAILKKYGVNVTENVEISSTFRKLSDGSFWQSVHLVSLNGVNDQIESVELQENAFRVIYDSEMFDVIEEAYLQTLENG